MTLHRLLLTGLPLLDDEKATNSKRVGIKKHRQAFFSFTNNLLSSTQWCRWMARIRTTNTEFGGRKLSPEKFENRSFGKNCWSTFFFICMRDKWIFFFSFKNPMRVRYRSREKYRDNIFPFLIFLSHEETISLDSRFFFSLPSRSKPAWFNLLLKYYRDLGNCFNVLWNSSSRYLFFLFFNRT